MNDTLALAFAAYPEIADLVRFLRTKKDSKAKALLIDLEQLATDQKLLVKGA